MKKILSGVIVILTLIGLCSCAQEPVKKAVNATDLKPAIEKFGDVEQIYEKSASRFATGETVLNYKGNDSLVFIANLVEYNSLTKVFADYVETITAEPNAAPHQGYMVTYDSSKKYVEFCAYVNKTTGEVVEYEIRVFNGDFINKSGEWNAKSCDFNNTLTRDVTNNRDVDFGFALDVLVLDPDKLPTSELTYDCKTGEVTTSDSKPKDKEQKDGVVVAAPAYDQAIADEVEDAATRIGTIAKMYDDGKALYTTYTDCDGIGHAQYICMAEYTSLNSKIAKLFEDEYNQNGFSACIETAHSGFADDGWVLNAESVYVEVIGKVDSKTGKISSYVLKRIDPEGYIAFKEDESKGYFATTIELREI